MTAPLWLAVAGCLVALVLAAGLGRLVALFCRGCSLVERKHWMED